MTVTKENIGQKVMVSQDGIHWHKRTLIGIYEPDELGNRYLAMSSNQYFLWPHAMAIDYMSIHSSSGLKPGDWVKVTHKPDDLSGWKEDWVSEMDKYLGGIYCIYGDNDVSGFVLGPAGFHFPAHSLEKVKVRHVTKADRGKTVFFGRAQGTLETMFYQIATGECFAVVTVGTLPTLTEATGVLLPVEE